MLDFAPSDLTPRYAFDRGDKVTIGGIAFRPIDETDKGYVFIRLDGEGVAQSYSRSEIARLVSVGHLSHERGALLPEGARARLEVPSEMLSMLPVSMHRRAIEREAVVVSFQEMVREGLAKRTAASITDNLDAITGRAAKRLKRASKNSAYASEVGEMTVPDFSERSLRRWDKAHRDLGIGGLYDDMGSRGSNMRRLCPTSISILAKCVNGYMSIQKPTVSKIFDDVKIAFSEENARRRKDGDPELKRPSKETVRKAILKLDPYHCDLTREGVEHARRKHAPVGMGLNLTRPLQRVELDTWKIDLIALLVESGLLHGISENDLQSLGLTGKKKRWHLTVASCATTRCIVGMRLSQTPTAYTTVQVIDMIMRDKGFWTDAVGALSTWHMCGTPEQIVTDCGSEYVGFDVSVAARDLGITLEHAPGGLPEMRARIERVFRTASVDLMQRLTGRTFSNMIERGDYDSKARAALTADDLCQALIRWVVDIYHRRPHSGLDKETPANCWNRLVAQYGVNPGKDLRSRRIACGTRLSRTIQKDGITILGIRYHSEKLAEKALRLRNKKVKIRWYCEDIGEIEVEIGGEWFTVSSVFARHRGLRAQVWMAARCALSARFKHEAMLEEQIIFETIRDIEKINGDAMQRLGLLVEDWTEERLLREEERLFIGFGIEPDAKRASAPEADSGFGEDLSTGFDGAHESVNEKVCDSGNSVSVPASTIAVPDRSQPHPAQDDDGDDLEFEIEDK